MRQLRDHPVLGFLYEYFKRVRHADMNAWDISVTMVRGSKYAEAFRPHYDRTLTDHMAHTASIGGLKARAALPATRGLILWQVSVMERLHFGEL